VPETGFMPPFSELVSLGMALGLGLLIGMQRERSEPTVAGVRTFSLITLLGALAAIIGRDGGPWFLSAGLIVVVTVVVTGKVLTAGNKRTDHGITTLVAAAVMYVVGAMCVLDHRAPAVAVTGVVYVLLHSKAGLHAFIGRLTPTDLRAIAQFVLISLVILPVLPDQPMGPYGVLNPFKIWLMVVLVVSVSLIGYLLHKFAGQRGGVVLSGVLGGVISSTATTVSMARRSATSRSVAAPATVVLIATAMMYVRLIVVLAVAAPGFLASAAAPLGAMFLLSLATAVILFRKTGRGDHGLPKQTNPTELKWALIFAAIYAVVLVGAAFAKDRLGDAALLVVASISGLHDMDAITLSMGQMVHAGTIESSLGHDAVIVAAISNLVCKGMYAWLIGGPKFGKAIAAAFSAQAAGGFLLLWL
jgi:uncharacterized membrane protein (DUF4010 family)